MTHLNYKKIGILAIAAVLVLSLGACSRSNPTMENPPQTAGGSENLPAGPQEGDAGEPEAKMAEVITFSGTILDVQPVYEQDGKTKKELWQQVKLKGADDSEVFFSITDKTYFATDADLAVGDNFTGFYAAGPIIMIYPPRFTAEVVAVNLPDSQMIKVDRFDEELVSSDGQLKLNDVNPAQVTLQDGEPFEGDLAGRKLVIFYDKSTKSIPAQTTPQKIVVLFEE